jgi:1-phosphofructokinase family hexose kinase
MVIAGPNPTVDRVIDLDRFDPGRIHRAEGVHARIGGGGINAARVASRLGTPTTLVTLLPEIDEGWLVDTLREEGVSFRGIRCRGQLRVATIVREREGRMSMLTEPGAGVDVAEWEEFHRISIGHLTPGQALVCSGSLPPGAPTDGYARMARAARHEGARCIMDAAGGTLAATLEAGEGLAVPNLAEAEGLLYGKSVEAMQPGDTADRARAAVSGLLELGAHAAVVTAGGAGVAFAERGRRGESGWVRAPDVEVTTTVGAGDAFAAGLATEIERGAPLGQAVPFGVAVAAAHVEAGPALTRERADALKHQAPLIAEGRRRL